MVSEASRAHSGHIMKSLNLIFSCFETVLHQLFLYLLFLSFLYQNKRYLISSYADLGIVCMGLYIVSLNIFGVGSG